MNKYLSKSLNWLSQAVSLGLDSYHQSNIITSEVYNNGFTYASHKLGLLIKNGYSSNTDVYSIISKIIRTGANIPYKIVSINSDGTEEEVTEGAFYDSVMKPNKKQNKFEFTEDALGYQLTTGNELLLGLKSAGTEVISKVHIVPPQHTTIKIIGKDFFENIVKYILMQV